MGLFEEVLERFLRLLSEDERFDDDTKGNIRVMLLKAMEEEADELWRRVKGIG